MLDVSRVTPEARPIVEKAAAVYLKHTASWFVGLVIHGSAMKGGFIPGCSDVDLHANLLSRRAIGRAGTGGYRVRSCLSSSRQILVGWS